jgi:response regulator RpfG family c-di-GMP phosphodiesterase
MFCIPLDQTLCVVDGDMLTRVWNELEFHIDVCRITKGGHIERLRNYVKKLGEFLCLSA